VERSGLPLFTVSSFRGETANPRGAGPEKQKPAAKGGGLDLMERADRATHFCHVRFLCRLALSRLRRLCFDIFNRRFFFRLPMEYK
jgi:hypothetical protein